MRAKGFRTSGLLLVVLLFAPCLTASAEVPLSGPLPEGFWTDLLHLGSDFDQRITGGQIGNDYLNPESDQMPYPGMEVADIAGATENPMVWTPLHDDDGRWSTNFDNYVKYWHIYIISPTERQVKFQFGHDDDFYVYNNGIRIIKHDGYHGGQLETEEATLAAGMNSITMKLKEGGGGDYMEIKVTDLDGNPMPDLTYSLVPMLTVTGFTVSDYDSGSSEYTNETQVAVSSIEAVAGVGATITGYMITESDIPPALTDQAWSETVPATYTFNAGPGAITLYAWAKDSDNNVASRSYTIQYQTESLVAKAKNVVAEIFPPTYASATVSPQDIDDGSIDLSGTGITDITLVCIEDTTPNQPFITLNAAGDYTVTMIVTNGVGEMSIAEATITIKLATETTNSDLVWTAGAGPDRLQWYWGLNWDYGIGPQLDTPAVLTFGVTGAADGAVTSELANDRAVRSLVYNSPADKATISHTTDLGGHTLTITNQLFVGAGNADNCGLINVTFQNGTLQIGNAGSPASIVMGQRYGDWRCTAYAITLTPGMVFVPYLADLRIGDGSSVQTVSFLDLRDVTVPTGTLAADNLTIRSSVPRESSLRINDGTGLQLVDVANTFSIGDGMGGDWYTGFGHFGDPDNNWLLPAGLSFEVGDRIGDVRGNVIFGQSYWGGHGWGFGQLLAQSGGTFDAYVTDMIVAKRNAAYPQSTEADVDISTMDSCNIDATNFYLGVTEGSTGGYAKGTLKLPAGTLKADSAFIGDTAPNADSYGTLELNGTVFTVTTALQVDHQGTVRVNVPGSSSCGPDLTETATAAFNEGSMLEINFVEPLAEPGNHWGLRWFGDHVAELETLQTAGQLVIDDSALGETAGIFTDGTYTYVGVGSPIVALDGDANGDCKVNIIDLIYIRNRLNKDVTTGDNAAADVNNDGKINIIDLIYVRNRLNTRCE